MNSPQNIIGKLVFSIILIAGVVLGTIVLSNSIFPNSEAEVKGLLKHIGQLPASAGDILLRLKLSQGVQTIGIFLLPALVMLGVLYRRSGISLMLTNKVYWRDFFDALFLILFSSTIMALASQYSQLIPWPQKYLAQNMDNERLTRLLLSGATYFDLSINLLIVCVIPAICEEFFFRGFLQRMFMKWLRDPHICIFFTAVIFSAFHFDAVMFLPRFLLGAMLGYLFYWTGSIWLSVFAHFINNMQYVVSAFILNRMGKFPVLEENSGFEISTFNVILSVVLIILLLFTIYMRHMNVKVLPKVQE